MELEKKQYAKRKINVEKKKKITSVPVGDGSLVPDSWSRLHNRDYRGYKPRVKTLCPAVIYMIEFSISATSYITYISILYSITS